MDLQVPATNGTFTRRTGEMCHYEPLSANPKVQVNVTAKNLTLWQASLVVIMGANFDHVVITVPTLGEIYSITFQYNILQQYILNPSLL